MGEIALFETDIHEVYTYREYARKLIRREVLALYVAVKFFVLDYGLFVFLEFHKIVGVD